MPRNPTRKLTEKQRAEHARGLACQIHKAFAARGGLPGAMQLLSEYESGDSVMEVEMGLRPPELTRLEISELADYINTVLQYCIDHTARLDVGGATVWHHWKITDAGELKRYEFAQPAAPAAPPWDAMSTKEFADMMKAANRIASPPVMNAPAPSGALSVSGWGRLLGRGRP